MKEAFAGDKYTIATLQCNAVDCTSKVRYAAKTSWFKSLGVSLAITFGL